MPAGAAITYKSQRDLRELLLIAGGVANYSLASEPEMIACWLCEGVLLDLLSNINAANGTRHFIKPADDPALWYTYTTRNRSYKIGAAADAAIDATSDNVTATDGWRITADGIVNQQTASVDEPVFPTAPITIWEYGINPPLPRTVVAGSPLTLHVSFSDYVTDTPTVHMTFRAGDEVQVSYLHHGQTGDFTVISVGASIVIKAWTLIGRQAVRKPTVSHTANDSLSQAARGLLAGPEISGDWVGSFDAATGIAEHIVWRYADRAGHGGILRPTLTIVNWLPDAFRLDLYDIVSVTSPQLHESARLFEIIGLTETCNMAADPASGPVVSWTIVYQLQECRVQGGLGLFTLDTSTLDGTDVLAY